MKSIVLTLVALVSFSASCFAGSTLSVLRGPSVSSFNVFDEEFQFDLSANYTWDSTWGGSLAANYFFDEKWGLGVEVGLAERDLGDLAALGFTSDSWDWNTSFNGFFRYPFEDLRLAPYAYVGVGAIWDSNTTEFYHGGVGVDYRLGDRLGLFLEYRYRYTPNPRFSLDADHDSIIRGGVRLTF